MLKIVTKNLADPIKYKEEKYRQLKLDNAKIQQNLEPCRPHAMQFLSCLGFVPQNDAPILMVATPPNIVAMQAALEQVTQAWQGLTEHLPNNNPPSKSSYQRQSSSSVSADSADSQLSEKQKARRLLAQKQQEEKNEAKRRRQATAALIQQDKYVRQNDANWTSAPSAACHKSGTSISTFRDRHGEQ